MDVDYAVEDVVGLILRCRRAADMSQRDLAAALGVAPSTVARWETGAHDPGTSTVAAIARLAGMQLALVLTEELGAEHSDSPHTGHGEARAHDPARSETGCAHPSTGRMKPAEDALKAHAGSASPGISNRSRMPTSAVVVAEPWPRDTLRSRDGRRLPAHLDVHFSLDGPPHRDFWWPVEQEIYVPFRKARDRLRRTMQPWDETSAPAPTLLNTRRRMLLDMATVHDRARWQWDHQHGWRATLAAWHRSPEGKAERERFEAETTCLCPDACWIEQFCVAGCPCGCEDKYGRATPVDGRRPGAW